MLVPDSRVCHLTRCRGFASRHLDGLVDRRRFTFAIHVTSNESYNYFRCAERFPQTRFPGPARARAATVQVEGGDAKLWIGVTGEMRFGQQVKPGDAARRRKLMPLAI